MDRPTGPLPSIPSETENSDSSPELVVNVAKPSSPLSRGETPMLETSAPSPQPNRAESTVSQMEGGEGTLEKFPSISSRSRSLASSVESTTAVAGSCGGHDDSPTFSMHPEDYKVGAAIGFGSSAIVYHTIYLPTNMVVAVKMIDLDHFERNQIDELRREIQVMTLCKHGNLLRILASFVYKSKLWIVTPYLSGGSCLDIMKTGFRDGLDEVAIATILHQALLGLEYLHRNGHIHRDVKAGNLLMDHDGTVQLADFGVSSSLMEDIERRGVRKTFVGTPCWMAPEVMEMSSKGYNVKADIWSFGITALELAYGHAPFSKHPPMKVIYLTLSSAPPSLDRKMCRHKYSRAFKDMIETCLQRDPSKRPPAEQLLKHPFFKIVKKKLYLVTSILNLIPPLEQRPRVTKLASRTAQDQGGDQGDSGGDGWDFSEDLEETESEANVTGYSTTGNSPLSLQACFGEGLDRQEEEEDEERFMQGGVGEKKSSRFVVEPESSGPASPNGEGVLSGEPEGQSKVLSPPPEGEVTEGEESGIKKGRFSVLESASPSQDCESSELVTSNDLSPVTEPIVDAEEGRRSRFQVEKSTVLEEIPNPRRQTESLPSGRSLSASQPPHGPNADISTCGFNHCSVKGSPLVNTSSMADGQISRFHVSQPTEGVEHHSSESIPAPYPRGNFGYRPRMLYEEPLSGSHIDSARDYGSVPNEPHGSIPPPPFHSYGNAGYSQHLASNAPIFVHPSQIDQLLLLNELVHQQLAELRNSGGAHHGHRRLGSLYEGGGVMNESSSYQPTIHRGVSGPVDDLTLWERQMATRQFRGPGIVEDPHIAYPPQLSAYSPRTPIYDHNFPWNGTRTTSDNRTKPTHAFSRRRSVSIDHRHLNPPPSNLNHSSLHTPSEHYTQASTRRAGPKHPQEDDPSSGDSFGWEQLRGEVEALRRENERLRKQSTQ